MNKINTLFNTIRFLFKVNLSARSILNCFIALAIACYFGLKPAVIYTTVFAPFYSILFLLLILTPYAIIFLWIREKIKGNEFVFSYDIRLPLDETEQWLCKELYCISPSECYKKYQLPIQNVFFKFIAITAFVIPLPILSLFSDLFSNKIEDGQEIGIIIIVWLITYLSYFVAVWIGTLQKDTALHQKYSSKILNVFLEFILKALLIYAPITLFGIAIGAVFNIEPDENIITLLFVYALSIAPITLSDQLNSKLSNPNTPNDPVFDFKRDYTEEINLSHELLDNTSPEYLLAYNNGWLPTRFAAMFIHKKSLYLIRKRRIDKYFTTIHNLPCVFKDNEYLYPVEALVAFKKKDWTKLNELRQKMLEETI